MAPAPAWEKRGSRGRGLEGDKIPALAVAGAPKVPPVGPAHGHRRGANDNRLAGQTVPRGPRPALIAAGCLACLACRAAGPYGSDAPSSADGDVATVDRAECSRWRVRVAGVVKVAVMAVLAVMAAVPVIRP
jgi:hypothetical protein